jgi:hypothetical protein
MKLFIGFIAGFVVGGFVVSNTTEQQRRKAREAAADTSRRLKESRVGRAVDDNASKVVSTAGERVAETVDSVGDSLSGAIGSDTAPATS